jgi:hypothetical protein
MDTIVEAGCVGETKATFVWPNLMPFPFMSVLADSGALCSCGAAGGWRDSDGRWRCDHGHFLPRIVRHGSLASANSN